MGDLLRTTGAKCIKRIYHLSLDKILAFCISRGGLFDCELLPLRKYRTLKSITTSSSAFHCHLLAAVTLISLFMLFRILGFYSCSI